MIRLNAAFLSGSWKGSASFPVLVSPHNWWKKSSFELLRLAGQQYRVSPSSLHHPGPRPGNVTLIKEFLHLLYFIIVLLVDQKKKKKKRNDNIEVREHPQRLIHLGKFCHLCKWIKVTLAKLGLEGYLFYVLWFVVYLNLLPKWQTGKKAVSITYWSKPL